MLQTELWPLDSVPADVSGQLSPFAMVLPALFPFLGTQRHASGWGQPPSPHPGTVQYGTNMLHPDLVGAGALAPSPTATPWLSLQVLPPFVFVFAVFIR